MNIARLAARAVIGGLFVGHGTQKLLGWFGGPGIQGTAQMMESLELKPARRNAIAAGASETAGGALMVLGLATPLASAALIGTMITAIRKVHWPSGPWVSSGGYEYNLVLIASLLALAEEGPGDVSLDMALGLDLTGPKWSLTALGLGAAASSAAVWIGRKGGAEAPTVVSVPEMNGEASTEARPERPRPGTP